MSLGVEIQGIQKAATIISRKFKKMAQEGTKEIHQAGLFMEREVKLSISGRRAEPKSVDTGQFRNSIRTDNSRFMLSVVSTNLSYAKYLEFGTTRVQPRRHFRNSKERNRRKVYDMVREKVFLGINS